MAGSNYSKGSAPNKFFKRRNYRKKEKGFFQALLRQLFVLQTIISGHDKSRNWTKQSYGRHCNYRNSQAKTGVENRKYGQKKCYSYGAFGHTNFFYRNGGKLATVENSGKYNASQTQKFTKPDKQTQIEEKQKVLSIIHKVSRGIETEAPPGKGIEPHATKKQSVEHTSTGSSGLFWMTKIKDNADRNTGMKGITAEKTEKYRQEHQLDKQNNEWKTQFEKERNQTILQAEKIKELEGKIKKQELDNEERISKMEKINKARLTEDKEIIKNLKEALEEMQMQLKETEKIRDNWQETNSKLQRSKTRADKLEEAVNKIASEKQKLEQQISNLHDENGEFKKENKILKQQNSGLCQQIASATKEYTQQQNMLMQEAKMPITKRISDLAGRVWTACNSQFNQLKGKGNQLVKSNTRFLKMQMAVSSVTTSCKGYSQNFSKREIYLQLVENDQDTSCTTYVSREEWKMEKNEKEKLLKHLTELASKEEPVKTEASGWKKDAVTQTETERETIENHVDTEGMTKEDAAPQKMNGTPTKTHKATQVETPEHTDQSIKIIQQLEAENLALRNEAELNKRWHTRMGELDQQIMIFSEENSALTQEIEKVRATNIEILTREQKLSQAVHKEIKQKDDLIQALEQSVSILSNQIGEVEKKQANRNTENKELTEKIFQLKDTMVQKNGMINELQATIAEQQKRIKEEDTKLEKVCNEVKKSMEERDRFKKLWMERLKQLQEQNKELQHVADKTQEEINRTTEELDHTLEEVKRLEQRNQILQFNVQCLSEENRVLKLQTKDMKSNDKQKLRSIKMIQNSSSTQEGRSDEVEQLKAIDITNNQKKKSCMHKEVTDGGKQCKKEQRDSKTDVVEVEQLEEEEILQRRNEPIRDYRKRLAIFCKRKYKKSTKQQKKQQELLLFIEGVYDFELRLELQDREVSNMIEAMEIAEDWESLNDISDTE